MSADDRFFAWIGKAMSVFALLVVALLVAYALHELYVADVEIAQPTFTMAPDTGRKAVKP